MERAGKVLNHHSQPFPARSGLQLGAEAELVDGLPVDPR